MRIAVLGAGYAGLTLARRLERTLSTDHEIIVVNDSSTHLVQHEIHRVIRRPQVADDIVVPLEDVLERATIRVARVERVDPDIKTVTLADESAGDRAARAYDATSSAEGTIEIEVESEETDDEDETVGGNGNEDANGTESLLEYDLCAVCLGAETDFHDIPGIVDHATPLKRLADAERIREDFLAMLPEGGRVVVCGAGLSGVQVAGELAALAREEGARDAVEIILTEALNEVAPAFPTDFSRVVRDELEERNVRIRTNAPVERATSDGVVIDGTDLAADQLIWAGGIRGPAALDGARPVVKNTLQVSEGTFVVGDAARVIDADGEAVPASAQSAVRAARTAAKNIVTLVESEGTGGFRPRLAPFNFDSPGWLVSVGDGAVAQVGPTVLRGRAAKALKTTVGAGYLTSVGAIGNAVDLAREELSDSESD